MKKKIKCPPPALPTASQELCRKLQAAAERREFKKAFTFNAYALKIEGIYSLPFFGRDDRAALAALKSIGRDIGINDKADVYCIGIYEADEGKLLRRPPRIILEN